MTPRTALEVSTLKSATVVTSRSPWSEAGSAFATPSFPTVHQHRSFTVSASSPAKPAQLSKGGAGNKKKKRKGKGDEPDPRIINLKLSIPRKVPAPLRFARNRALRHWTIHRAWLLYQRKEREREERELMRLV